MSNVRFIGLDVHAETATHGAGSEVRGGGPGADTGKGRGGAVSWEDSSQHYDMTWASRKKM